MLRHCSELYSDGSTSLLGAAAADGMAEPSDRPSSSDAAMVTSDRRAFVRLMARASLGSHVTARGRPARGAGLFSSAAPRSSDAAVAVGRLAAYCGLNELSVKKRHNRTVTSTTDRWAWLAPSAHRTP